MKYFDVQELVPPDIYDKYGDTAVRFLDSRIITGVDFIREYFGAAVTINDWQWGGQLDERGFRPPWSKVGAQLSQHKFGRAIDFNVEGVSSDEVFDIISEDSVFFENGFRRMEHKDDADTWTHLDCAYTGLDEIYIFHV